MSTALIEQRQQAADELLAIADALEAGSATDEQRARATELQAQLRQFDADLAAIDAAAELRAVNAPESTPSVDAVELRAIATPATPAATPSVRERSPYGADADASWFRDKIMLSDKRAAASEQARASERLTQHYGSTSDAASAEQVRAMSTTGNASDLVAPAYVNSEFIAALDSVCNAMTLVRRVPIDTDPYAHTTSVRIPKQTARVGIAEHTENDGVTSSDVTTTSVRVDVSRGGGLGVVPNFMLQRSFPGLDQIIAQDLANACAEDLNATVLTKNATYSKGFLAASGLGSSTYTSATPTAAGFYSAVLNSLANVLAGVKRGGANAILLHPTYWFWLLGKLDANTRAYIGAATPNVAIGVNGAPDGVSAAGHIAGVPVILDAAIPTNLGAGTNETRAIVAKFDESWLLASMPRFAVSEHSGFDNDQTKIRATIDRGFTCGRIAGATSIVSGTGMIAS